MYLSALLPFSYLPFGRPKHLCYDVQNRREEKAFPGRATIHAFPGCYSANLTSQNEPCKSMQPKIKSCSKRRRLCSRLSLSSLAVPAGHCLASLLCSALYRSSVCVLLLLTLASTNDPSTQGTTYGIANNCFNLMMYVPLTN